MTKSYDKTLYFRGDTKIGKTLRFFNLLEPGKMVLSISKLFMWMMIVAVIVMFCTDVGNLTTTLSTVGGTIISTGNYMYRRHLQSKEDGTPEAEQEPPESGEQ